MRTIALLLILAAAPALAEGRSGSLMSCTFGGETVVIGESGGKIRAKVGDLFYPAAMVQPGSEGRVGAVFVMLDAGPMMIAVETAGKDGRHIAAVTAARAGADDMQTRTTQGTCTEATP
jgi:hypothetical protein